MNTIGKISGKDWSKAHEEATHVAPSRFGMYDSWTCFYKQEDGIWYFDTNDRGNWDISVNANHPGFKPISKEEDLGMNKQVKSIEDLSVGMFVKGKSGGIYLITSIREKGKSFNLYEFDSRDLGVLSYFECYTHWSYTYNGEYTPIVKETEQELKLKELESEAKKLLEAAEKVNQQIKELKGE